MSQGMKTRVLVPIAVDPCFIHVVYNPLLQMIIVG